MGVDLRTPGPDDAQALADLHWLTWQQTYTSLLPAGYFSEQNYAARLAFWNRALADDNPALRLKVAQDDSGALLGFGFAGPPNAHRGAVHAAGLQLYSLYVLSEHHGTGLGQRLLDEVLGGDPAVLWVAKENPRAIAFYLRNGFEFDGEEVSDPHAPEIIDARMVRGA
ncbi:N-acetyltransferase [Glutamicibacter uratoxydans]|uniref:N-acetyltransferase n=1 Tax=Glutamicibacter uratoxydans TaxID=43667 RepID=A0A4Y4DHU6_GLUUR|nr:GNAT family N-acetyltransferase [Glutamicibacter uratoxydans]GED04819.1 N-acetyltransferase [Glutamicibacter uratoxydans]